MGSVISHRYSYITIADKFKILKITIFSELIFYVIFTSRLTENLQINLQNRTFINNINIAKPTVKS